MLEVKKGLRQFLGVHIFGGEWGYWVLHKAGKRGEQGGKKNLGPELVRGPKISLKRLVMGATVKRVGGLQCVITRLSWSLTLTLTSLGTSEPNQWVKLTRECRF